MSIVIVLNERVLQARCRNSILLPTIHTLINLTIGFCIVVQVFQSGTQLY